MVFLGFLFVPLLLLIAGYFLSKQISGKALALSLAIVACVAGISTAICYYDNVSDIEVWNGSVSGKRQDRVSCGHSYSCNCRSCSCDSKGNCSTCCDTCYEHTWDYNWNVYTTNQETITIDRVDRQGVSTPPRWTVVQVGEPTTVSHRYDNYIKGSPGTLFKKTGQLEKFAASIPKYPQPYDYYKMDRLLVEPGLIHDQYSWNQQLADINAKLGHKKQVNAMVLITKKPREFYYALEQAWIGGKKNDAILVVGVDSNMHPSWVEVMAWVLDEGFKVRLKDAVLALSEVNREGTLALFEKSIAVDYKRKPMHDFEYLKASIVPSSLQWFLSILIGSISS